MILTAHFFSNILKTNVSVNLFIPTPEGNEQITDQSVKKKYPYQTGLPVVYLLHGAYGNCYSWTRFSNVERYAQKFGCVLVMASAENSFYHDMYHGSAYYTFFSKELPAMVKNIFPVSDRREDTYIAGFSMGGYGAWYLALRNPENYCKAASMSGALDLSRLYHEYDFGKKESPVSWDNLFEDPARLEGSSSDLLYLYDLCRKQNSVPDLYQSCGTEDSLYSLNLSVRDALLWKGASLKFEDVPGGHTWDFWDKNIQNVFSWMFSV
jgi:putative tributyrin esterase